MSKRKSKTKATKDLKQTSKEAMKAGLTPGQIAGIIGGSVAVIGLGTTAAVLAARDPQNYTDYKQRVKFTGNIDNYPDNFYDKFRGYRQRYKDEIEERRKRLDEFIGKERSVPNKSYVNFKPLDYAQKMKNYQTREAAKMSPFYNQETDTFKFGRKKRRKRRKKVKKKRKFGGSHKTSCGYKFGKKVSKKPSAALRRMCKRLKVRLTLKRGKKRVYKSEKVLKKQCRKAKRRKRKK